MTMDNQSYDFGSGKLNGNGFNKKDVVYLDNLDSNNLSAKVIIARYIRHWPWFVLGVAVCLLAAYFYLLYTTPIYHINARVLIKNESKGAGGGARADVIDELDIFNKKNNVGDEEQVLRTSYLMRKVADELNLSIRYFRKNKFGYSELYQDRPFNVKVLSLKENLPPQVFRLQSQKQGNSFRLAGEKVSGDFHYGDIIRKASATFVVEEGPSVASEAEEYLVSINDPQATAERYSAALITNVVDKSSNVIQLNIDETVPKRGEDILNKLYEIYTRIKLEDKYRVLDSTISFIDSRLSVVGRELSGVEKNIERFKTSNRISTDVRGQSALALTDASDIQKKQVAQTVLVRIIQSLEDHIRYNTGKVVPNASEIQDPTYVSAVEKYNNLVLERDRQLLTTKPDNPLVKNLDSQIESLQKDLVTSLENIKKGMVIAQNEFGRLNNQVERDLLAAPRKERVMLDISRQQDVKQQLYLYLLQKREETAIAKSGTLANSILIEPARSDRVPFSPKPPFYYCVALFVGLLIPGMVIFLIDFFNNRLKESKDIFSITQVPVLGQIGHKRNKEALVAKPDSRTPLSEQFRSVRANLSFMLPPERSQVVMVTSSMNGEGKTFCSINLASCLAISRKKVVLVDLDLRKPQVAKELGLGLKSSEGFTAYMRSQADKAHLAKPTDTPNLFVIEAGAIPSDPAELLLHEKVRELFEYLKSQFDYVIVDTPPLGMISDALLIGKYADASIYVVRHSYTLKQQLGIIDDLSKRSKLRNLSIIVNDVKADGWYGYGYGFYADQKKPFWKKNNLNL